MDYKYIEQLMERYWNCGTSLEEEQILRSFFRQQDLPAHLLRYKALFACQEAEKERGLGDDFDAKVLARVERPLSRPGVSPCVCASCLCSRRPAWWLRFY